MGFRRVVRGSCVEFGGFWWEARLSYVDEWLAGWSYGVSYRKGDAVAAHEDEAHNLGWKF